MVDQHGRLTLGRMHNPVRGFLHGTSAIASAIGAAILWERGGAGQQVVLLVFALSMVCLYTVSSLYHSYPWRPIWKQRMQRVDHSMIYVLIAGTYTPIAWIVLDGWMCGMALGTVWGITLVGILQKVFWPQLPDGYSVALQTIQGWLALPLFVPLSDRLPSQALLLMAIGGVFYTVGMVFHVTERPRLWPRVFSHHEMFHIFVVAGSAAHYTMMFAYVARFSTL